MYVAIVALALALALALAMAMAMAMAMVPASSCLDLVPISLPAKAWVAFTCMASTASGIPDHHMSTFDSM